MTRGQYLERPTLIPLSGGLVLEGLAHRGAQTPGLLVLPPPPLEGGGMDHVLAAELTFAAARAGHSTLRFNYRGVGGSQGAPSRRPEAWLEDAIAALELAVENSGGAAAAVVSIGASDAVALELGRRRRLAALAWVSPRLVGPGDLSAPGAPGCPLSVVLPELEPAADRAAWGQAMCGLDGELVVIPEASAGYARNLPMVGHAVAALLARASPSSARLD